MIRTYDRNFFSQGHSAGGYDSTHAILSHPKFYKACVSSAGCHDNRMDKAVWNEQWMGWPVEDHYEAQSNYTIAHQLEGKLLIAHGGAFLQQPSFNGLIVVLL